MADHLQFYIDGQWVQPSGSRTEDVINPATEQLIGRIAMGEKADVDRAVAAARKAFETFSQTSREERVALLEKIIALYKERIPQFAAAVSQEMGAPIKLANAAQAPSGLGHFMATLRVLKSYEFEEDLGTSRVIREPIGVVGMITPWNWPLNQIACKVAPALAAGCTMVLKPSEVSPINAILFAQLMHDAGVPAGVFNLVNGDGPTVGAALSSHPDVDMMSFTGSTRAGIEVARAAAGTVKRVAQELGGKSANIILDDADFEKVIKRDMFGMCVNSGQSCNAGSRMLVPKARMDEAAAIAKAAAERVKVGDPASEETAMGPVVSKAHWGKVQGLIQKGIDEGAKLATGGPGLPDGLSAGYFVKPTVFSHVTNDMTIAREEIFGPVIVIIGYENEDDAVRIANDTVYGLSGYISSADPERAKRVARRLRTGNVHLNGAPVDSNAPFGGYKQSGNGREWGRFGFEDYLEVKAIMGYNPKPAA
jgi:aldehyde dehydrogenase (NAD+)